MARRNCSYIPGLLAGANLASDQFTFMVGNGTTANSVVQASSAGVPVVGVLTNKPASGQAAEVAREGVVEITLGGTLSAWTKVCCSSAGLAVAGTTGNTYVGYLLEGGVANDIVSMVLYNADSATHA